MEKNPTDEQQRRRRRAALELRRRAADLLDEAHRLDCDPAMRILVRDIERIARRLGIDAETLTAAITSLWPQHPDNPQSDADPNDQFPE